MKLTSRWSRITAYLVGLVLILGVLAGGAYYVLLGRFQTKPAAPSYPTPTTRLEAQRQDLDYFGKLMALDRSYSPEARAAAQQRLGELKALGTVLPTQKLRVALMQIIALTDNGHSRVPVLSPGQTILVEPVRVTRFAEGFIVMRARTPYSALLGGRIESIDGVPFETVLARLETLRGGTEAWRRENAAGLIVLHDVLYGAGIAHDPKQSRWTVRKPDGEAVTMTLTAAPLAKDESIPPTSRWLSPEPRKGADADWVSYQPVSGALPESLRHYDDHFSLIPVPGSCAVDVRLQSIADSDGQKISPFLQETEAFLEEHRPCAAILDLRGNGGGNYMNTWRFTHALPQLVTPGGKIYVLTDAGTFSAAISTTGFVKNAGGDMVKIVGEPVGDRLVFYSEGGTACLPNSKICVNYQVGKHDYSGPCQGWDCFGLDWFYPVRVTGFAPDHIIPRSFADWNSGRDAAYEWALGAIRSGQAAKAGSGNPG